MIMSKKTLLIVDDEKLIRWALEKQLSKEGYDIFGTFSGEVALKSINRKIPDFKLLDVMLPDSNGLDLLRQIKEIDNEIVVIQGFCYSLIDRQ